MHKALKTIGMTRTAVPNPFGHMFYFMVVFNYISDFSVLLSNGNGNINNEAGFFLLTYENNIWLIVFNVAIFVLKYHSSLYLSELHTGSGL